jgi:hypothetical protein
MAWDVYVYVLKYCADCEIGLCVIECANPGNYTTTVEKDWDVTHQCVVGG